MPKSALIGQIVDGEDGTNLCVSAAQVGLGVMSIEFPQENAGQTGLPVVQVEDVGPEVQEPNRFEDGPRKEAEASAVVVIVDFLAVGIRELINALPERGIVAL